MATANQAIVGLYPGRDRQVMRWVRVFPGVPEQVAAVRRFVGFLLHACPAKDDAVACASELAANAVIHTASGKGGFFSVEVVRRPGAVRVAVTDAGAPTAPAVRVAHSDLDDLGESGLGLALVAVRASVWGYAGTGSGRTVWAEIRWHAG